VGDEGLRDEGERGVMVTGPATIGGRRGNVVPPDRTRTVMRRAFCTGCDAADGVAGSVLCSSSAPVSVR
jgi:hypothetical protein